MAQVRLFEADSQAGLADKVNAFLAGLPLGRLLDVEYGMAFRSTDGWAWHWCLVAFLED